MNRGGNETRYFVVGFKLWPTTSFFGSSMVRLALGAAAVIGLTVAHFAASIAATQARPLRPPVIDVHVHSTNTSPQAALERMKSLHIRYLFVSSLTADLPAWSAALNASQFLPALVLPCDGGRARIAARREADDIDALTDLSRKVGAEHDPLGKTGLHQLAQITKIADSGQSLERGDVYMYVGVAVQESQQ